MSLSLDDTTEVDEEYYPFVDSGAIVHIHAKDKSTSSKIQEDYISALNQFFLKCLQQEPSVKEKLDNLLSSGNIEEFQGFIASLPLCSEKTKLSDRISHPEWFEGTKLIA